MKIYISGKITGLDLRTAELLFRDAETEIKQTYQYTEIVNPLELAKELELKRIGNLDLFPALDYYHYLANSIIHLFDCDMIYQIENWQDSPGAMLEYYIALEKGINIINGRTHQIFRRKKNDN